MDALTLYKQLKKGAAFFNQQFLAGNRHPLIQRKITEFEVQVMRPLDRACAAMTPAQRRELEEAGEVPF